MDDNTLLEKLNRYTRRELSADEVYIFPVTLCDNEIDRDNERFSRKSLDELAEKFIGVTGIFDHNPKGENQTARVFATEVVEENRKNSLGERYAYLKGYAYMVRTSSNSDLIREIDGGIKKEISVSCSADRQVCSVCGTDRRVKACRHVKGRTYEGKKCFVTLENISDAYEWSFVAVPAQVRAGVTKGFEEVPENTENTENAGLPEPSEDSEKSSGNRSELEKRICAALDSKDPSGSAKEVFSRVMEKLDDSELDELCGILSAGKPEEKRSGNCEDYMTDFREEDIYGGA